VTPSSFRLDFFLAFRPAPKAYRPPLDNPPPRHTALSHARCAFVIRHPRNSVWACSFFRLLLGEFVAAAAPPPRRAGSTPPRPLAGLAAGRSQGSHVVMTAARPPRRFPVHKPALLMLPQLV
jgi:hypothetical protein